MARSASPSHPMTVALLDASRRLCAPGPAQNVRANDQLDEVPRGVEWICAGLDEQVAACHTRPHDHYASPCVVLDATYCKARINGRVVSQAVVIATGGVSADGRHDVLGSRVGDSKYKLFWTMSAGVRLRVARRLQCLAPPHELVQEAVGRKRRTPFVAGPSIFVERDRNVVEAHDVPHGDAMEFCEYLAPLLYCAKPPEAPP